MPYFEKFAKEPGPDWVVTVKREDEITEVTVFGGDEARARLEGERAIREEDDDVIEILKVEKLEG